MGLGRLELPTSRLSGVYSNQLSYRPVSAASWEGKCYTLKCQAKGPSFLSFFRYLLTFPLTSTKNPLLGLRILRERGHRRHLLP